MIKRPLVSICVPVYGVENFIERCARSLLSQTYPNLEFIFVNDNTQDKSIEILKSVIADFPEKEQKTRIVNHKSNRGLSASRNTALINAKGDYVMHVDSDDWIDSRAVELLVDELENDDFDIVTGQVIMHKKDFWTILDRPHYYNKIGFVCDLSKATLRHTIWGRLIKRSLYVDNKVMAEEGTNIGEDLQVMPQLAYYAKKTSSIESVIYHYNCTNESSYTGSGISTKRLKQDLRSAEIVYDFFCGKEPIFFETIKKTLLMFYISALRHSATENNESLFKEVKTKMYKIKPNTVKEKINYLIAKNYYLYRCLLKIL